MERRAERFIFYDDGTPYLTVKTFYDEQKVSIAWLDKSGLQIKQLTDDYRGRAGSGQTFKAAEEPA